MHPTCYARVNDVLTFYYNGVRIVGRVQAISAGRMTVLTISVAMLDTETVRGLVVDYNFNNMEKISNSGPNAVVNLNGWNGKDILIVA